MIFPVRDLTCPDIFIFGQTCADLERQWFILTCTLLLLLLYHIPHEKKEAASRPSWKTKEAYHYLPSHYTFLLLCSFLTLTPIPLPPLLWTFRGWGLFSSLLCLIIHQNSNSPRLFCLLSWWKGDNDSVILDGKCLMRTLSVGLHSASKDRDKWLSSHQWLWHWLVVCVTMKKNVT